MRLALFVHLVGVVLGFGTVMFVDIVGALWVLRRATAKHLLWATGIGQKIIWSSVGLLIASGIFLIPPEPSLRTKLKLLAVLILIINGFFLDRIRKQLGEFQESDFWKLPRGFQIKSVVAITLSQLMWWTAVIIGFLNSSSHVVR